MKLTKQQLSTILAALRLFQNTMESDGHESVNDMAHFDDVEPLTSEEVNDLCEELNFESSDDVFKSFSSALTHKIARLKLDGEFYDEDRNRIDEDEALTYGIEPYVQEADDAISCLFDLITEARGIISGSPACHAPTDEDESITCTCHLKEKVTGPVPHCCPRHDGDYSSFLAQNNCD